MCALLSLRQFVNERLTSAAEEIFGAFEKTIVEYEEEIHRQRKLLQMFWKPEVKLHRIDCQQQHVCEDQDQEQQDVCVQRKTSSLDQKHPDSVHIKEEELWSSEEGEQLGLKQETAAAHQESDHSEDCTLKFNIEDVRSLMEEETLICVSVQSSVVPEANSEQQLLSHNSEDAENQHQEGGKHGDSGSTTAEPEHNSHTNPKSNENRSAAPCDAGEASLKCNVCKKAFTYESLLQRHMTRHSVEKPFTCKICRRDFRSNSHLKGHMRIHTNEKPYVCKICEKGFYHKGTMKRHMIFHTDDESFTCKSCGKMFGSNGNLNRHMRSKTCKKSFICQTCGRKFKFSSDLYRHMRCHTEETSLTCQTCGRKFKFKSDLYRHMRSHTRKNWRKAFNRI